MSCIYIDLRNFLTQELYFKKVMNYNISYLPSFFDSIYFITASFFLNFLKYIYREYFYFIKI